MDLDKQWESPFLKTPRLILRPFTRVDADALYRIFSNPETVRFQPYPPFTREDAEAEAEKRAGDPAFSAVCLREDGRVIGSVFCKPCAFEGAEIAYVFDRAFWGSGYATEAVSARIEDAFRRGGIRRVVAMCDPENVRSWRLMERAGMRREGCLRKNLYLRCTPDGEPVWQDTYLYAILKEEFPTTGEAEACSEMI